MDGFKALALVVGLACSAFGQIGTERFWGLNDTDVAASLDPAESPDTINVESNIKGTAAIKRKGFAQEATLTVTTAPITGSHAFTDSSGNNLTLVFHDRYASKSTNNGAFSNWLTTAPASITRWQCVSTGGKAYCVNDQRSTPLEYDGTTQRPPATMPLGGVAELCNDRLVISDISATPKRVAYSQSGTFTNFTTGTDSADPWTDDLAMPGQRVTAVKCDRGRLFIFTNTAITSCVLGDQYTTKCFPVSNSIGTTDPASVVGAPDGIYFKSQDRTFWRLSDDGLSLISRKIENFVKSQNTGSQQSNTQTTLADWQAGAQAPGGSWSTATVSGSVFPSSVTFVDNSSNTFNAGTLTRLWAPSDHTLVMSSRTLVETFADGDYTTGSATWTVTAGAFTILAGSPKYLHGATGANANAIHSTSLALSSGSWTFDARQTGAGNCQIDGGALNYCFDFQFVREPDDFYSLRVTLTGGQHYQRIVKSVGGSETVLASSQFTYTVGSVYSFKVDKSSDGRIFAYRDGVFISSATDTAVDAGTFVQLRAANDSNNNDFTNFYWFQYQPNGSIISRTFDTAFSTPVFGVSEANWTKGGGDGNISMFTQSSSDGSSWDTRIATSTSGRILSASKRYVRYQLDFTNFASSNTVTLSSASLAAVTTGQYWTQCIQPGAQVTSYGLLSCDTTTAGNGSLVFYATSAYSCAALPATQPVAWTSVNNNAALSITVSSAVYIGFRSLLGSTTDQAQVNACTLYWTNGTAAQPTWGTYDSLKNAIYWNSTISNNATSNRVLKLDLNLAQWYPFDLAGTSLLFNNGAVYFGGSAGATWNKYGLVDSDNGAAINAYWKSKDFASDAYLETDWKSISVLSKNQVTGTMTNTYTLSTGQSGAYSVSIGTTSTKAYARSMYLIQKASPANFINLKFANNSTTPFEVLGVRFDGTPKPWFPTNP